MPTHNKGTQTEDAPKITNGERSQKQFVDTEEMNAIDRAYKRDTETAAELSSDNEFNRPVLAESEDSNVQANSVLGWIGIVLALASFFFWPLVLAIGGIVVGAVAKSRNADTLGNIAIIASVV